MTLLVGFVLTIVHAYLARWVASFFVGDGTAHVAGFSFALGVGYAATGNINRALIEPRIALLSGALLGLTLIWYLFFKRAKANG